MAKQMDPKDVAGIAFIYSKIKPSESPVFISYYRKEEWNSIFKLDGSLFGDGGAFANYMKRVQAQSAPSNVNKNFAIYPKGLKVTPKTLLKMQAGLAMIDCDWDNSDPQNIGLLAMLCVTTSNGFTVPKELIERMPEGIRYLGLMMGVDEYRQRFYPRSSEQKLHDLREKMRVFLNLPKEEADEKSNNEDEIFDETDNTSSVW